ncbi:diacylglycerol/lipid kinase family protein [Guggenheimella bovis]
MRNFLIIENINAGKNKKRKHVQKLIHTLKDAGHQVTHDASSSVHIFQEKYKDIQNLPYTDIVICGGDGTLNAILNTFEINKYTFTLFPVGSANDFYLKAAGPTDFNALIDRVLKNQIKEFDIAKANDHYFINNVGIGIDVLTLEYVNKMRAALKSGPLYFLGVLRAIATFKPMKATITLGDEVIKEDSIIVIVSNGSYFGGGMNVSPHSDLEDGELDLVMLKNTNVFHVIKLFSKLLKAEHLSYPSIIYRKVKNVKIEVEGETKAHLEGEIIEKTPLHVEVLPQAIRMIV